MLFNHPFFSCKLNLYLLDLALWHSLLPALYPSAAAVLPPQISRKMCVALVQTYQGVELRVLCTAALHKGRQQQSVGYSSCGVIPALLLWYLRARRTTLIVPRAAAYVRECINILSAGTPWWMVSCPVQQHLELPETTATLTRQYVFLHGIAWDLPWDRPTGSMSWDGIPRHPARLPTRPCGIPQDLGGCQVRSRLFPWNPFPGVPWVPSSSQLPSRGIPRDVPRPLGFPTIKIPPEFPRNPPKSLENPRPKSSCDLNNLQVSIEHVTAAPFAGSHVKRCPASSHEFPQVIFFPATAPNPYPNPVRAPRNRVWKSHGGLPQDPVGPHGGLPR